MYISKPHTTIWEPQSRWEEGMGIGIKHDRENNKTRDKQIKVEKCAPNSDKLLFSR